MDMVERVAAAIRDNLPVDNRPTLEQCYYPARAAIEAMREPTEAMVAAGSHMTDDDGEARLERARGIWWAMLNKALEETKL